LIPQRSQSLRFWSRAVVWLAVFLSPTAYCLLLIVLSSLLAPARPEGFVASLLGLIVVSLFCLIPIVALLVCGSLVWLTKATTGWRVGGMILTSLAMALQVGVLLLIIVSAITVAIS
jgi:hypothetical protein